MKNNPRCATPAIEWIMANWKQEPSPYDDPVYEVPTYQREKIIPEQPKHQIQCATPAMDEIFKLAIDLELPIATGETDILKIQKKAR